MTLLVFFLSFLFGAYIKILPFILPLISCVWLIFLWKRFGKITATLSSLLIAVGIGASFLNLAFTPKNQCSGFVYESKTNYYLLYSGGQRFYVYSKNNTYEIGDYISVEGTAEKFDFTVIESQFDFENFLNNKGIIYEYNVTKVETKFKNPLRIRAMRENFLKHFDDESAAFIGQILFNQYEENEVNKYADILHLGRFISTSGVYVYAFVGFFFFIFWLFFKKGVAELLAWIPMIPFIVLNMPNFTVIRITLMFIAKTINKWVLNKRFTYLSILTFVAVFVTFCNFYVIYSEAFILGFSIPLVYQVALRSYSGKKGFKKKIYCSFIVYFFFIPFEMKFYNSVNLLLFPISLLLTPLFIFIGITSLFCLYGIPMYAVPKFGISGLTALLKAYSKIPLEVYCPPFNDYLFIVIILISLVFLYYLEIRFKPFYRPLALCLSIIYCSNFIPIKNMVTDQVSFINVGQGDCCMIRNKFNTILIDTGGSIYTDIANDSLIPYFKKNRMYNIDLLITTHNDYDHMGAVAGLQENFRVKRYVTSYADFPIQIGDLTFTNYNTFVTADSGEDDNYASLVIGFNVCKMDFLITGDAPIEIEKKIMASYSSIPCDILKVGHHGSKTSTCDEFVKYLSPKEAVISVGKKNKYKHPNKSVIDILNKNHVVIKRTDYLGTISYSTFAF